MTLADAVEGQLARLHRWKLAFYGKDMLLYHAARKRKTLTQNWTGGPAKARLAEMADQKDAKGKASDGFGKAEKEAIATKVLQAIATGSFRPSRRLRSKCCLRELQGPLCAPFHQSPAALGSTRLQKPWRTGRDRPGVCATARLAPSRRRDRY